ncbi:MAG: ATP-binding cassette domain-containing protein [Oscillospiraceae bacterium]|nr:ATP-binding cassette domain-containing protein [Oscillospiraceae bacterium]
MSEQGKAPIIAMKNVIKTFVNREAIHALHNINLTVCQEEFVFIIGRNGSGKSTLFNLILNEIKPTQGEIIVGGHDLAKLREKQKPYYRRQIGVVFQDHRLLTELNVFDNIAEALRVTRGYGKEDIENNVRAVMDLVGLDKSKEYSYVHQLSGGECQRVAIARAIVNKPKLLLADEPTGNIDPDKKVEIVNLFFKIRDKLKTTVLMITHDHEIVKNYDARLVTLEKGKIYSDDWHGVQLHIPENDPDSPIRPEVPAEAPAEAEDQGADIKKTSTSIRRIEKILSQANILLHPEPPIHETENAEAENPE